ncbi:multifunctional CCA addition/repair protein [Marinobacter halodurans]|uniref:CCA-adding enzyme n=1 Tax=Marinobacter halodurans TaxID=2528979 RepID=A0ABY1ZLG0_9GAMM|nr:multifunctional CCA addition/repair protein [Marinobacter halodurans]TBW52939.1 multifunctional CCA addition/repair protein [Marinobacter halodurans]
MDIYLVGGAVRDALLGLPVKDRDWVVVGATPEDMIQHGFRQVGADFPVFLHPQSNEEYALARTERKRGHGYHGFAVHSAPDVTLEDDLRRRDLTINAMARAEDGTVVDPFNGQQDLEKRLLRHVSPAFAEDPLRILRVARFAARFAPMGFCIADETRALMCAMVDAGEVEHLVPERVWQEVQRALQEASPTVFFNVLQDCGALAVLMPALAQVMELEPAPLALRALQSASELSNSLAVRFAALAGSLDEASVEGLCDRLKVPNDCRALATHLAASVDDLLGEARHDPGLLLAILDRCDAWRRPERFGELLVAARAVALARHVDFNPLPIQDILRAAKAVDPRTLMDEGYQGKALGQAIRRRRYLIISDSLGLDNPPGVEP